MKENAFLFLKNWFQHYVHGFYSMDAQLQFHIRLKEEHTMRVLENAKRIGTWLSCTFEQMQHIKIAALLHDIGRFQQYQTYRTFNDALSVNHAQLGLEVLQESGSLQAAGLNDQEQKIVKNAVLYHNRRELPIDENLEWLTPAKIVRDADKIDIFSMLVTKEEENKIPLPLELGNDTGYSAKIVKDILQGKLVEYPDIKTGNDLMLFRLSWIYDIYFSYSFSYIIEQGYIEKLIAALPAQEEIACVQRCLWQYAKEHAIKK
ncbi:HD domain-containing protein [Pelosinus propionicus]|uniref:HDIG domain-containing protein n=1 Tax=Pelosinus propionicus DSM 13327 TaxID=1123291 RepID=A0A1I4L4F6_9FIRM|nr:HD domain-containing protein [Pelosinus propionicus]SFL85885.1 HDIG domain-containing protein [Pelosinus propionicus DSM 13327]